MSESRSHANAAGTMIVLAVSLLLGLPLLGVVLAGKSLDGYLDFPPLTRYVEHAGFSWFAFALMTTFIVACVLPFVMTILRNPVHASPTPERNRFPRWGLAAIAFTLIAWAIAWTRLPWFTAVQSYTFIPLWLGYIVSVNAVTLWISGRSPLTHETRAYVLLFPVSAAFWWFFEYLNRFVQNWYYVGIDAFAPFEYALWASLAFSTVLPAVCATRALLATIPRLQAGLDRGLCVRLPRCAVPPALLLAAAGLLAIGIWPDWTYPMVWLAPLVIIVGLQILLGRQHILSPLAEGDWRDIWLWVVAALVCGFFWETWNFLSTAKWVYAVPFVHRFEIFEMPLLGYAGYLPFGLECAVVVNLVRRWHGERGVPRRC